MNEDDPYLIEKAQNLARLNAPEFDEVKRIMAVRPSISHMILEASRKAVQRFLRLRLPL